MDAFRNYENLMAGIGQDTTQMAKNAKTRAIFNAKNRTDEIIKTVGEAKTFISGKPLMQKVGQVLKPKIKKGVEDLFKKVTQPKAELPDINAEVNPNAGGPTRLDAIRNKFKSGRSSEGQAESSGADETENIEMENLGAKRAGAEVENKAFDATESGIAETSAGQDITTGLEGGFNAGSNPVFNSVMSQTRGSNLQNAFANARQNKFNPREEDGQSQTTPRSTPQGETQATSDAPLESTQAGSDALGADGKLVADEAARLAAKEAGGEVAGGILDAIPGADVIGLLVGGIVTAVGIHRAHKAEEEEKEKDKTPFNPTNFSFQAGVGTD